MGYHDIQLPTKFSVGSLFGPGFNTSIIELDNLAEQRIQRGPASGRRQYALERGIDGLDSLLELLEFYIARQGALNSFRLKDWLDYATTPTRTTHRAGDAAVSNTDEDLVLVSGTTYQLVTRYVSGSQTIVRSIKKPVVGTVVVRDDTGSLTPTINYQTGQITLSSAPTGQVTGGCEFDVPVRFSEETDRNLAIAISAVEAGNLPSITCIEDVDPVVVSQDFPWGGAKNHGDIAADVSLSELDGRLQIVGPTTTGKSLILPNPAYLPAGGPYFRLENEGSESVALKDHLGSTLATITAGSGYTIWLGLTAATTPLKAWFIT